MPEIPIIHDTLHDRCRARSNRTGVGALPVSIAESTKAVA
jgi:hypothetical protein